MDASTDPIAKLSRSIAEPHRLVRLALSVVVGLGVGVVILIARAVLGF